MDSEKKTDVQGLIEKGKSQGTLSSDDIMEVVDLSGYDVDQVEKLYETLESSGIEVSYNLDGDYGEEG
jgi:RNA polymerase primary sigma factor